MTYPDTKKSRETYMLNFREGTKHILFDNSFATDTLIFQEMSFALSPFNQDNCAHFIAIKKVIF